MNMCERNSSCGLTRVGVARRHRGFRKFWQYAGSVQRGWIHGYKRSFCRDSHCLVLPACLPACLFGLLEARLDSVPLDSGGSGAAVLGGVGGHILSRDRALPSPQRRAADMSCPGCEPWPRGHKAVRRRRVSNSVSQQEEVLVTLSQGVEVPHRKGQTFSYWPLSSTRISLARHFFAFSLSLSIISFHSASKGFLLDKPIWPKSNLIQNAQGKRRKGGSLKISCSLFH